MMRRRPSRLVVPMRVPRRKSLREQEADAMRAWAKRAEQEEASGGESERGMPLWHVEDVEVAQSDFAAEDEESAEVEEFAELDFESDGRGQARRE